jgi:hypothetical protein
MAILHSICENIAARLDCTIFPNVASYDLYACRASLTKREDIMAAAQAIK